MQLIHAAKLESLGVLSAAVAHEVKNPLQTILMGLDFLDASFEYGQGEVGEVLRDMRDAVVRARLILSELVNLSRASELTLAEEDVNQLVQRALSLVRYELLRAHIQVATEWEPKSARLRVDKAKIEQALINLFTNALHAMPSRGVLTVRTRTVSSDPPHT